MWTTIVLIAIAIALFYKFLIWNFNYWTKQGIVSPKPVPFAGNYKYSMTQKKHMLYDIDELYRAYKQDEDFVGIFSFRSPQLLILNPNLVHRVFVNDFKYFHDNEMSKWIEPSPDFIFGNNPFILTGDAWKEKRALLTPGLAMSRIKTVYPTTNKVCSELSEYLRRQIKMANKDGIDAKDLGLRFTSEVVTDCVLGLEADSFSDKPTPILTMTKKLFDMNVAFLLFMMAVGLVPSILKVYRPRFIAKDVEQFFHDLMQTAIDVRKSKVEHKERVDYLNYLLQLQKKNNFSTMEMTTNTMTFLIDGFESTAIVLAHFLLLLGRYPEKQQRLRDEIKQNLNSDGFIDFEKLTELPYLDTSVHESIRIFPPAFFSNKLCTEPITLTAKNGRTVTLKEGDVVVLPTYSIQTDEEFYPNPEAFEPERFLEENGASVKSYRERGLYHGFGDGPRSCLGMRFALTQIKAATVEILKNFEVHVNPKTRKDNLFDPKSFFTRLEGGIWLDFKEIN